MSACLLVIDAQQSFVHRPYFDARSLPEYLKHQNALIAGCQEQGIPIVRVFHVDGPDVAANAFSHASGHIRPIEGLRDFQAAHTVVKRRHSALVGTDLEIWLVQHGITSIIVSGIRTEQCCETTTRHASDLGWQVLFVTEATLTWDMQQPDGSRLSAADICARTATVLQSRFAQVATVEEALARQG